MTTKKFSNALGNIGESYVDEAVNYTAKKKSNTWLKWGALAACFALIVCAIPLVNVIFDGANHKAPISINYDSLEDMNNSLSKESLYNNSTIDVSKGELTNIAISFIADQEGKADMQKPTQARIDQKIADSNIRYYILFGKTDIEDSYIAGYEEQNLSFVVNGITVHYSTVQYKATYESQAKFVYDGNIYVIDVTTPNADFDIKKLASNILS